MKKEIGDVLYDYGRGLYANITNRCPCRCEFCIRNMTGALGTADSLWLKQEPTAEQVIEMLKEWDLSNYDELVFCGYGEPTERLDLMLSIARYVKENTQLDIRVNTNGLADLINGRDTATEFEGIIDTISISLNQCDAEKYDLLCHSDFGLNAFPAILKYAEDIKEYVPNVAMSVVSVIPADDIEACSEIAAKLGVTFRVR